MDDGYSVHGWSYINKWEYSRSIFTFLVEYFFEGSKSYTKAKWRT
jgi:hypothetical protein